MEWPMHLTSAILATAVALALTKATFEPFPRTEASYDCEVHNMYVLGEDGALRHSNYSDQARGDRFVVSRATGQVIGSWLPTANATSVEVLRQGDDASWGFESFARFDVGPNHTVQVINVRQFHEGPKKPFVAAAFGGAGIVTGFCDPRQ
jgi:hypothetical protein